jgi:hypothetical protein
MTPVRFKPWSRQKRIMIASLIAVIILVSSFLIGSIFYGAGRVTGVFQAQNLSTLVTQEIINNPQLVHRFYASLDEQTCLNTNLGFELTIKRPLKLLEVSGQARCTELSLTNPQGGLSNIKIESHSNPADLTLNRILQRLHTVSTDSFPHPQYLATVVHGYQGEVPLLAVIFKTSASSSWSLTYAPANPVDEQVVLELAKSFTISNS